MERIRRSKVNGALSKLAVTSEDGLTSAQLMLTNHDLKPGMQWFSVHSDGYSQFW